MKRLSSLLLVFFGQVAVAALPDVWLSKEFPDQSEVQLATLLQERLFFEIPVSKMAAAEERLAGEAAVAQQPYETQFFGRAEFICPASSSLFLLRAVYTNGSTGAYQIQLLPSGAVWVSHHSLGRSTGTHRSALLACLNRPPSRVFISSSGAI